MTLWFQFLGLGGDLVTFVLGSASTITILLAGLKMDGYLSSDTASWSAIISPLYCGLGISAYYLLALAIRGYSSDRIRDKWQSQHVKRMNVQLIWPCFVLCMLLLSLLLLNFWFLDASSVALASAFSPIWVTVFFAVVLPDAQQVQL